MHANSPLLKDEVLRIVDAITEFTLSGNKVDNSKNKEHLFFSKKDEKDDNPGTGIFLPVFKECICC